MTMPTAMPRDPVPAPDHSSGLRLLATAAFLACATTAATASAGFPEHHVILQAAADALSDPAGRMKVSAGRSLRPGDSGSRVADLRHALASLGFTESVDRVADGASDIEVPSLPGVGDNQGAAERAIVDQFFDDDLRASVIAFQRHSGLEQDGIAGPATLNALNGYERFAATRLSQAMSLPDWPISGRHIFVNIAAAETYAVEDGVIVLRSRSIVGSPYTRTPSFSQVATSVTMNPTWTVPPGIAARKYDGRSFVMPPGPRNPLGKIRIDMPNRYLVFLHGTDDPDLFERDTRALSSGCVRVEGIVALANWLTGDTLWDERSADHRLAGWSTHRIPLTEQVPVTIEYRLASVTPEGVVAYHPDIYGILAPAPDRKRKSDIDSPSEDAAKVNYQFW